MERIVKVFLPISFAIVFIMNTELSISLLVIISILVLGVPLILWNRGKMGLNKGKMWIIETLGMNRGTIDIKKPGVMRLSLTVKIAWASIFLVLIFTVVFNYGGDNFCLRGLKIPLVWILIAFSSLLIGFKGMRLLFRLYPFFFSLWLILFLGGIAQIFESLPKYGISALRDSVFFLASIGLPLGILFGWLFREHYWKRLVTIPIVLATIYALSYPWSEQLWAISPKSGVFKEVSLLGFHCNVHILMASIWGWFIGGMCLSFANFLLVGVALLDMAIVQSRLAFMSCPIAGLISLFILFRAGVIQLPLRRVILFASIGLLFLTVTAFAPIPGKLGKFQPHFLLEHLGTVLGRPGPAYGSILHRIQDYPIAVKNLCSQPIYLFLSGNGLGAPIELGVSGIHIKKLHLDLIEIIYRSGIVGMVWFLMVVSIMVAVLQRVMSGMVRTLLPKERAVLIMICSFLVYSVIVSFFEPVYFWAYGAFPYYFYGGLSLGIAGRLQEE